jgi:uncharacterized sulfatase
VPLLRSVRTADGFSDSVGFSDQVVERPARQETLTARYTEEATALLRRHASHREQPFFLYLAYSMPHVPLFRSEGFVDHSAGGRYGDVIEEIDWSVGEIARTLEQLGLAENTLLVFTSDNGPWLHVAGVPNPDAGSAGALTNGKGTTFEGGVRVPAVFWWPGSVAPGVVSAIGSVMDLFATGLSLAGAEPSGEPVIDGFDLLPVLRGQGPAPRTTLAYYRAGELQAWRSGRYKLQLVSEGAYGAPPARQEHHPPRLYDLGEDPAEAFDLAASRPDVLSALAAQVRAHRDSLPPAAPLFDRRLIEP